MSKFAAIIGVVMMLGVSGGCMDQGSKQSQSPSWFWVSRSRVIQIVKSVGYQNAVLGDTSQNPSGTRLFIWDHKTEYPDDVYVIGPIRSSWKVYSRCWWNWFNDDGTPFARYSPDGTCQLTSGGTFPCTGIQYHSLFTDGLVRYVAAYRDSMTETSVFDVRFPSAPIFQFTSEFYPTAIRSAGDKIYLFGGRVNTDGSRNYMCMTYKSRDRIFKCISNIKIPGKFVQMIPNTSKIVVSIELLPTLWRDSVYELEDGRRSNIGFGINSLLLCAFRDWTVDFSTKNKGTE